VITLTDITSQRVRTALFERLVADRSARAVAQSLIELRPRSALQEVAAWELGDPSWADFFLDSLWAVLQADHDYLVSTDRDREEWLKKLLGVA
jgi:hypothetical protein